MHHFESEEQRVLLYVFTTRNMKAAEHLKCPNKITKCNIYIYYIFRMHVLLLLFRATCLLSYKD